MAAALGVADGPIRVPSSTRDGPTFVREQIDGDRGGTADAGLIGPEPGTMLQGCRSTRSSTCRVRHQLAIRSPDHGIRPAFGQPNVKT